MPCYLSKNAIARLPKSNGVKMKRDLFMVESFGVLNKGGGLVV
jgi:hypothetical protein